MHSNSTYLRQTFTWKDSQAAKRTVNDFHTKVKWLFLLRELGVQLGQLGQMDFVWSLPNYCRKGRLYFSLT